jgi:hypothetical protein
MDMQYSFDVTSGKVNLSDPCYDPGTWCAAFNIPAANGKWNVEIEHQDFGQWGVRNKSFIAYHQESSGGDKVMMDVDFGVDSGQFGIFDTSIYHEVCGEYDDNSCFYGKCCDVTLNQQTRCGVVDKGGFVTSSGFGDGSYEGYAIYNEKSELIYFSVNFCPNEEN